MGTKVSFVITKLCHDNRLVMNRSAAILG